AHEVLHGLGLKDEYVDGDYALRSSDELSGIPDENGVMGTAANTGAPALTDANLRRLEDVAGASLPRPLPTLPSDSTARPDVTATPTDDAVPGRPSDPASIDELRNRTGAGSPEQQALSTWNDNASGRNQGLVHLIDYSYAPPAKVDSPMAQAARQLDAAETTAINKIEDPSTRERVRSLHETERAMGEPAAHADDGVAQELGAARRRALEELAPDVRREALAHLALDDTRRPTTLTEFQRRLPDDVDAAALRDRGLIERVIDGNGDPVVRGPRVDERGVPLPAAEQPAAALDRRRDAHRALDEATQRRADADREVKRIEDTEPRRTAMKKKDLKKLTKPEQQAEQNAQREADRSRQQRLDDNPAYQDALAARDTADETFEARKRDVEQAESAVDAVALFTRTVDETKGGRLDALGIERGNEIIGGTAAADAAIAGADAAGQGPITIRQPTREMNTWVRHTETADDGSDRVVWARENRSSDQLDATATRSIKHDGTRVEMWGLQADGAAEPNLRRSTIFGTAGPERSGDAVAPTTPVSFDPNSQPDAPRWREAPAPGQPDAGPTFDAPPLRPLATPAQQVHIDTSAGERHTFSWLAQPTLANDATYGKLCGFFALHHFFDGVGIDPQSYVTQGAPAVQRMYQDIGMDVSIDDAVAQTLDGADAPILRGWGLEQVGHDAFETHHRLIIANGGHFYTVRR
ncbi:MAG: hypothetical protein AAFP84_21495, partial [Actinomycetota bacterium]